MFSNIFKKPVELVCALAMVAAGVYFSSNGQEGSATVVIGSVLSVLGGVLLSWATVSLTSKESAASILRPQLAAIARQLVSVSGQISKAVQDTKSGDLDPTVALEMISQASRIMYSSVNEIHVVLGERVDIQELVDTAERVEELASLLAGSAPAAENEIESKLMNSIVALRSQIQTIAAGSADNNKNRSYSNKVIPKAAPHERENTDIDCPTCGTASAVSIGVAFGSSAMPECEKCKSLFHAHRLKDGSIGTKPQGANISKG